MLRINHNRPKVGEIWLVQMPYDVKGSHYCIVVNEVVRQCRTQNAHGTISYNQYCDYTVIPITTKTSSLVNPDENYVKINLEHQPRKFITGYVKHDEINTVPLSKITLRITTLDAEHTQLLHQKIYNLHSTITSALFANFAISQLR